MVRYTPLPDADGRTARVCFNAQDMTARIEGKRLADIVAVPPRVWFNVGNGLRLRIVTRTRVESVDADGHAFADYSEGYKRFKAKKAGMVGRVNLTGPGAGPKMLDNIKVTARANTNPRIELWFATAEKATIAQYHMGDGRVDRKFFGLSDADIDYVVDYVRNWVKTGQV
jgi:hypothetical protein